MKLLFAILIISLIVVGVASASPMVVRGVSNDKPFITVISSGIHFPTGFVTITKIIGNKTSSIKTPYLTTWS
jgi:hypothetical protein